MSQKAQLSLWATVLININIMLGTGLFVNTVLIGKLMHAYGGLLYLGAGLIMLPLILSFTQLSSMYKEGNLYTFGLMISPYAAFITTWSYFLAKLASSTLSIHVFSLFISHTIKPLQLVPVYLIDLIIITLFVGLNTFNVRTGKAIQYFFVTAKATPLFGTLFIGLSAFDLIHIEHPAVIWASIPAALPLIIFCFLGFEAACSASRLIKDSEKNAPKAILYSFLIVMCLAFLYQTLFYLTVGIELTEQANYLTAFPLLLAKLWPTYATTISKGIAIAIGSSALGGAYGILYTNAWNLYTLADKKLIIGSTLFSRLNKHNIPTFCFIAEGFICVMYIALTKGAQIPLQYTATLGSVCSYTISVYSLYTQKRSFLSILGLCACAFLLYSCLLGFIKSSLIPFLFFGIILVVGTLVYYCSKQKK